jgi:hypothetical protein
MARARWLGGWLARGDPGSKPGRYGRGWVGWRPPPVEAPRYSFRGEVSARIWAIKKIEMGIRGLGCK